MVYKYKKIPLVYDLPLTESERRGVALFNQVFPKSEIQLEADGTVLTVLLREVDIARLREETQRLSNYSQRALFQDVIKAVEDVRSYGIRNHKRYYVDYDKERKVKRRKAKAKKRQRYYYAEGHNFSRINQPIPSSYENAIICGDSQEVLKRLPNNCVDIVLTSPPYNFGLDYEEDDDTHHWEKYFEKLFAIFDEVIRVLKWGGRVIVNIQPLFSDYIPSHHIISNFFMSRKLIWKGEILWEKNNYNCKYTAWGSWKSPSSPYLKYTWEFLEIYAKGTLKKEGRVKDIDIQAEEFKEWVVAKWSIAPERNMRQYGHPAMFPEHLVERALKLFSYRNDIVLDPFNGVGTTTAVAKRLGRRYLGIDISAEYCRIARERTEKEVFQPVLLEGDVSYGA